MENNQNSNENNDSDLDKTRVHVRMPELVELDDKTRVLQRPTTIPKNLIEQNELKTEPIETTEKTVVKEIDDSTQIVDTQILQLLKEEIDKQETEKIEKELKDLIQKNSSPELTNSVAQETLKTPQENTKNEVKKKKLTPVLLIVVLSVFYLLLFDDDTQDITQELLIPAIQYPISLEKADFRKGSEFYTANSALWDKNDLESLSLMAKNIKTAMGYERKEEYLGRMIYLYAKIYSHVYPLNDEFVSMQEFYKNQSKKITGNIIFKLIKEGNAFIHKDVYNCLGKAIFFDTIGKPKVALRVIKRFFYQKGKPNIEIFNYMLKYLLDENHLAQAMEFYKKLAPLKTKTSMTYWVMAYYHKKNYSYEEYSKIILEGLKFYPNDVPLLLELANDAFLKEDFAKLQKSLDRLEKNKFDYSYYYYSRYLELKGLYQMYQKKYKEGIENIKLAITITPNLNVQNQLSQLGTNTPDYAKNIVLEAKIAQLIKKSLEAATNAQWLSAFVYAVEASDLSPTHINANIHYASIQIQRGYFNEAITLLQNLNKKNPLSFSVKKALIQAYLSAQNTFQAKSLLAQLEVDFPNNLDEIFALRGQLNEQLDNITMAISWYRKAIAQNPTQSDYYYELSRLYIAIEAYTKARMSIQDGLDVGGDEVTFSILYAKALEKLEGGEVAIGYLENFLKLMDDIKEITGSEENLIKSEIAIIYYNAGKISQFEYYKKELLSKSTKSKYLLEFLIKMALLQNDKEKYVESTLEYLKFEPGNLGIRMQLALNYLDTGDLNKALIEFNEIKERLESYPKVLYYLSKIYIIQGDLNRAKEYALQENTIHPNKEFGHLRLGEIAMAQEKWSQAELQYKLAQSKNPQSVEAIIGLAQMKFKQNYFDEALSLYQKAAQFEPNNAQLQQLLGYAYKAVGSNALAKDSFQKYLVLSPVATDRSTIEQLISELQ